LDLIEIIIIAIGLAMDASAVSLVAAASGFAKDSRSTFRLAFHFGLFQFLMPVIGWLLGVSFVSYFSAFDHWIAFGLLSFVGGRMFLSGLDPNVESYSKDPSRDCNSISCFFINYDWKKNRRTNWQTYGNIWRGYSNNNWYSYFNNTFVLV